MQESLEVAVQCLETAFELSPEDATALSVSKSLLDIFQEATAAEVRIDLAIMLNVLITHIYKQKNTVLGSRSSSRSIK